MSNIFLFYIGMRANHLYTEPLLLKESLMGSGCFVTGRVGLVSDIRTYGGFFMDHKKNYDDYIAYVKTQYRVKLHRANPSYVYYEKHHIVPLCMGGSDIYSNIVLLTTREHYLAHYLLTKIYPDNGKLLYSFYRMHEGFPVDRLGFMNSSLYKSLRDRFPDIISAACKGRPAWNKGLHMSDEIIRKNSISHIGHVGWNKGGTRTDLEKLHMSRARGGRSVRCVETGVVYYSVSEVCRKVPNSSAVQMCLHGIRKTAAGFHWEYAD